MLNVCTYVLFYVCIVCYNKSVLYIFQRTLEQSKARRKRRKFMRRHAARNTSNEVPLATADVLCEENHLNSYSEKVKEANAKLLCYKKFKDKYMGEVNEMLLNSMKKRSQERMKASKEYVDSDDSSDNSEPKNQVDISQDCKKFEVDNAYNNLVENSLSEMENNCSPSLLLPAIVQPSEQITVHIKNSSNVVEKLAVKECLENLVDERDTAIKTVRLLRSKVEDLQSKNRKLYCEMNDKIDTVRNFWRNRLVEGDTRSGMCVKLAVQRNLSN